MIRITSCRVIRTKNIVVDRIKPPTCAHTCRSQRSQAPLEHSLPHRLDRRMLMRRLAQAQIPRNSFFLHPCLNNTSMVSVGRSRGRVDVALQDADFGNISPLAVHIRRLSQHEGLQSLHRPQAIIRLSIRRVIHELDARRLVYEPKGPLVTLRVFAACRLLWRVVHIPNPSVKHHQRLHSLVFTRSPSVLRPRYTASITFQVLGGHIASVVSKFATSSHLVQPRRTDVAQKLVLGAHEHHPCYGLLHCRLSKHVHLAACRRLAPNFTNHLSIHLNFHLFTDHLNLHCSGHSHRFLLLFPYNHPASAIRRRHFLHAAASQLPLCALFFQRCPKRIPLKRIHFQLVSRTPISLSHLHTALLDFEHQAARHRCNPIPHLVHPLQPLALFFQCRPKRILRQRIHFQLMSHTPIAIYHLCTVPSDFER